MIEDSEDIFDASVKFHDCHRFKLNLEMAPADSSSAEFDMEASFFVPKDRNDISPFNITEFIRQADDPGADCTRVAPDVTRLSSFCPRVYRRNLLLRYSYRGRAWDLRVNLERIRVVLSKAGMVGMEEVRAA